MVLTNNSVLKLDPANQFKVGTAPVPIDRIDAITIPLGNVLLLSAWWLRCHHLPYPSGPEPLCIMHLQDDNDVVFLMVNEKSQENRVSEFVTMLARAAYLVGGCQHCRL